jgi:hypothetical protein
MSGLSIKRIDDSKVRDMATINLTQGQVAIVDDIDYDFVNQFKWHCQTKYALRIPYSKSGKRVHIFLHHIIAGYTDLHRKQKLIVDHIDGNTFNNRRANLRIVTHRINSQNKHSHRNGRLLGAVFEKKLDKKYNKVYEYWTARIQIKGKSKHLGCFKTEKEAHEAYVSASKAINDYNIA